MFWKVGRGHCIFCRTRMSVWSLSIAKQIIRGVGKMRVWNILTIGKKNDQWTFSDYWWRKMACITEKKLRYNQNVKKRGPKLIKARTMASMWISTWDDKVLKGFCFRSLLEAGGVDRLMNVTRQRAKYTSRFFKWCRWWWWGSYLINVLSTKNPTY